MKSFNSILVWALALFALVLIPLGSFLRRIDLTPPDFPTPLMALFAALLGVLLAVALRPIVGRLRHLGRNELRRWTCPGAILPLLVLFWSMAAPEVQAAGTNVFQPGQQPRIYSFGGFPGYVATNATTNVTCGGVPVEPGRGLGIWSSFRTVGTENTIQIVSFEVSTNKPGSAVTNWFRPLTPITATFTNNGVATTNNGYALIPPTSVDNVAMIRPFSFRHVAGTNSITNLTFAASQTLVQ